MTRQNQKKAVTGQLAKGRQALKEARYNLEGGFPEAAVSRAYYAVYHAARAALVSKGVQPKTHRGVNERFNLDLVEPGLIEPELLSILGREQRDREVADYSIEESFTVEHARKRVEEAARFLERIERFLKDAGS